MRRTLVLGLVATWLAVGCDSQRSPPSPPAGQAARIVTLMPSGTEVVAALGAAGMLVGVDDYSVFPPEVKQLPKVGSFTAPNLESIVALHPTLVIVDDIHRDAEKALHGAGIATVQCAFHALGDVEAALHTVGATLHRSSQADAVIAEIHAAIANATAHRPAHHPKVLAIIDREAGGLGGMVAAGPGSWIDELLAVVGGDNVLATSGVRYPKISIEEVLAAKPDVILDLSYAAGSPDAVAAWRDVAVPAVSAGHVVTLAEPYLMAPSPRIAPALTALAKAIQLSP